MYWFTKSHFGHCVTFSYSPPCVSLSNYDLTYSKLLSICTFVLCAGIFDFSHWLCFRTSTLFTETGVPYGFTFHNYCVIAVPTLVLASFHPGALLSTPDFSFSLILIQTEFGFFGFTC